MFANRSGAGAVALVCFALGSIAARYWAASVIANPESITKSARTSVKVSKAIDSYSPVIIGVSITLVVVAGGLLMLRSRATPTSAPVDGGTPGDPLAVGGSPPQYPDESMVVAPNPLRHLVKPILALAAAAGVLVLAASLFTDVAKMASKSGVSSSDFQFRPVNIPTFDPKAFEYKPVTPPVYTPPPTPQVPSPAAPRR
jgi:hypothetical protein